ncbi:39S ribosomal protein L37, mitochondrial-like [Mercenaria mercenaria]|uniref:39S ribosomal protein L37, mitochondrial-like n=1 Tax=Mercenaria mercenaria TaxID=6596 RepID=UPI00234F1149|nr:39S ribosomal protein L37, mitochondrial-like [Mercenaria mercenaria]
MVRLSLTLCRIKYSYRLKNIREKKGHYRINQYPSIIRGILQEKGVEIEDPLEYINPPEPKWKPPQTLPPDFRLERFKEPSVTPKKHEVWHVSSKISLTEGIDQACLLTKTQRFDGLPEQVKKLLGQYSVDKQNEMVKDAIMQSQVWNNTMEKLPKITDTAHPGWYFPRQYGIPDTTSAHILLDRLLRMSQSMCGKFPDLATQRRVLCKPSVETTYEYQGETIQIAADNEFMVVGYEPLAPFGKKNLVNDSVNHQLLDMYPILPTVDLKKIKMDELLNRGAFREVLEVPCSHPQIVYRINGGKRSRSDPFQAYNLMTTFGIAIAEARSRYGTYSGQLETPVTVINVNMGINELNFIMFQLNTMDLHSDTGIKNFAWFDSAKMFSKNYCQPWLNPPDWTYTPPTYSDYNSEAFEKFLALYLYDYAK